MRNLQNYFTDYNREPRVTIDKQELLTAFYDLNIARMNYKTS